MLKVGDWLIDKVGHRHGFVKWLQNGKIGLRSRVYGLDSHWVITSADIEAGRWDLNDANPSTVQTGDNFTDDGEGESPSAMGADPTTEEDAAQGYTRERDRLRPKYKNQPIIDPASPPAGHSEIMDRVTQPPRDGG